MAGIFLNTFLLEYNAQIVLRNVHVGNCKIVNLLETLNRELCFFFSQIQIQIKYFTFYAHSVVYLHSTKQHHDFFSFGIL